MDGGGQDYLSLVRPWNVCNTVMVDRDWWIAWLDRCRFDDGRYISAIHTKGTTGSKYLWRQVFEDCRRCVIIVEVDVVASVYAWLNHAHYSGMSDTDTWIDIISPLARINFEVIALGGSWIGQEPRLHPLFMRLFGLINHRTGPALECNHRFIETYFLVRVICCLPCGDQNIQHWTNFSKLSVPSILVLSQTCKHLEIIMKRL